MLANKMSNQDEDEVEEELEALEREMLPEAPKEQPVLTQKEKDRIARERARRRAEEREAEQASQPMLA